MNKKTNTIILIAWAMILILNLIGLMYDPSQLQLVITGYVFGFFIHMWISYPLLNSYEDHRNFTNMMIEKLIEKRRETTSAKIKREKKK